MTKFQRVKLAFKLALGTLKQSDVGSSPMMGGLISGKQGSFPTRNTESLLHSFNVSPWVRACASRVADSMASVQWRLFVARNPKSGTLRRSREVQHIQRAVGVENRRNVMTRAMKESDLTEVTSHLFLDVIGQANPEMTGIELRWLASTWQDLVGDAFFLKERNGAGAPSALWPIPPHWIMETPSPSKPVYRISYRSWHQLIPESDILWLKYMNPVNPYSRGSGVARSLEDEISTDEMAGKMTLAFFRNNARPDILVMPKEDGTIGESERDRLQNWWTEQLQGYWRHFKPLFMTRSMDVKLIEHKFRDMQLNELREAQSNTIMQVWGIPPEILGRLESSNRATAGRAEEIFAKYVLIPRLERQRESLQHFLNMEYDNRLILTYDSPSPSDKKHNLDVFKSQPNAFLLNEWRDLAGESPMDELEGKFGSGKTDQVIGEPDDPEVDDDDDDDKKQLQLENLSDKEIKELHGLIEKTEAKKTEVIR